MNVYHVDFDLMHHTYGLTAYKVVKETPKQYKVVSPRTILGYNSWRSTLSKDDKYVFTDFDAAVKSATGVIQRLVRRNSDKITQMQNNIQALGKLTSDNWEDVLTQAEI